MPKPQGLVDRDEQFVERMADALVADDARLKEYVGERPFGHVKAPLDVQIAEYLAIRSDPNWWGQQLAGQGQPGAPPLKELVKYVKKFEGIVRGDQSGADRES